MACFAVPVAEAIVTTVITAVVKRKEKKQETKANNSVVEKVETGHIKLSEKLSWLNMMLWGGSILLMFEHVWHGEVVPWFPFLTAAESKEGIVEMLQEMSTVGVGMAVAVTIFWCIMVLVADAVVKNTKTSKEASL